MTGMATSSLAFLALVLGVALGAGGGGSSHTHSPHAHTPHAHTPQSSSPQASHSHSPHSHTPHSHVAPPPSPPAAEGIHERVLFVDESDSSRASPNGLWSHTGVSYPNPLRCAIDGTIVFRWTQPMHDVRLMASGAAYDACDFTGSTTLAAATGTGETSYYLPCTPAGSLLYVSCSIGGHCDAGQKVIVNVSSTVRAVDETTGDPIVHVDSLARIMTLMGANEPPSAPGTTALPLGYNTEAIAEKTLEFIWCLLPHCPSSARDYDPDATLASCRADVYNLGGFISRKRPTPQLTVADGYYTQALDNDPHHCPTLEYYTELHLMRDRIGAASGTVTTLCSHCGASSGYATLARAAFGTARSAEFEAACSPPDSSPPPSSGSDADEEDEEDSAAAAGRSMHPLAAMLMPAAVLIVALAGVYV